MQSGQSRGRYNKAVVYFMAVLLLLMALADLIIIRHQRNFLTEAAESQARRDLILLGSYSVEPLLGYDYTAVHRFLKQWGEEHPEVLRLAAIAPNSESTLVFERPAQPGKTYELYQRVSFMGNPLATLHMVISYAPVAEQLHKLNWQLGLASFFLAILAGVSLWFTFKIMAIGPLEKEIRLREQTEQELEAARNRLEDRVRDRTFDLQGANSLLQREVHDRKQAEERLAALHRQYELILNSAGEGIYGVDSQGHVTFVNKAARQVLGYAEKELVGRHLHDFNHHVRWDGTAYGRDECPLCRSYAEGSRHRGGESYFGRNDGSFFPVEYASAPIIENGREMGTVVVFEDITDRKKAEHDLLELTDTLELRVRKRTASLDAANVELRETLDQLQRAQAQLVHSEKMAALGDLVAGVAHEINTPVGIGVTAASHLEKRSRDFFRLYEAGAMKRSDLESFVSVSRESAKLILANLNRAADLIRSFKQVAIDQSGEGRRKFKVKAYVQEVCTSLRPLLKKTPHRVEINCDEALELDSYPGAFSQIVTNFITNSVTHAYPDNKAGCLRFDIALSGSMVNFVYSDDGKGMSDEEVEHVFDPFYTTNREKGGSGLGLHIVYNIVTQKLAGTLRCKSSPGEGASFAIRFPAVIPWGGNNGE